MAILLLAAAGRRPVAAGPSRRPRRPPRRRRQERPATSALAPSRSSRSRPTATAARRRHVLGAAQEPVRAAAPRRRPGARRRAKAAATATTAAAPPAARPARRAARRHDRRPRAGDDHARAGARPPRQEEVRAQRADRALRAERRATRPPRKDVKRLQALPSNDEPVLIYLGVLKDNKTAVFLVDSGVVAQGDGTCKPSPDQLRDDPPQGGRDRVLRRPRGCGDGRAAPPRAQYQLDVIKIRKTGHDLREAGQEGPRRGLEVRAASPARPRCRPTGPLRYRYDTAHGPAAEAQPQGLQGPRGQGRRAPPAPALLSLRPPGAPGERPAPPKLPGVPLRVITAGESHGPGLTCIVEGLPAGLELDREPIDRDMARRQLGHGRGGRMKIERDAAEVTAGRPPRPHARRPDRPARSPTATSPTGRSG